MYQSYAIKYIFKAQLLKRSEYYTIMYNKNATGLDCQSFSYSTGQWHHLLEKA